MCAVEREIVNEAGGGRPLTATPPTRPLASRDAQVYRDPHSLARLLIDRDGKIRLNLAVRAFFSLSLALRWDYGTGNPGRREYALSRRGGGL
jgi:hypothetical protein